MTSNATDHESQARSGPCPPAVVQPTHPGGRTAWAVAYPRVHPGSFTCFHQELVMPGRKFPSRPPARAPPLPRRCFGSRPTAPTGRSGPSQWFFNRSWVRQGDPAPGGSGCCKVGMWPLLVQEETVEYEQDRRHAYKLIGSPSPVKDYSSEVVFTPNSAGGTDIRWTGSFTEGVRGTGPVMRAALGGAVRFRGPAGDGGRARVKQRAIAFSHGAWRPHQAAATPGNRTTGQGVPRPIDPVARLAEPAIGPVRFVVRPAVRPVASVATPAAPVVELGRRRHRRLSRRC